MLSAAAASSDFSRSLHISSPPLSSPSTATISAVNPNHMQPPSPDASASDMQNLNLKSTQPQLMKFPSSLPDIHHQNGHHHFQMQQSSNGNHVNRFNHHAPPPPHDDFLEQMLSTLNSAEAWDLKAAGESEEEEENNNNGVSAPAFQFDEAVVASKLRAQQQQQQQMMSMPFGVEDLVDRIRGGGSSLLDSSSFDSFHPGVENSMSGLFNGGFVGSLLGSGQQMSLPDHFQNSNGGPSFEAQPVMNNSQAPVSSSSGGAAPAPPKQRVRARRGQATDPHSIAERLRRERIAERMKGLQELVPNANKTDKASMLDEIIDYVKFLQLQVKVLSMSRLGGAGAVAPLVADNMSSEGGVDSLRARVMNNRRTTNGGEITAISTEEGNNNISNNTTATVTENQVARLMEEDMGSAMQYLQSKGLCLMPISLATAISTAKNPMMSSSKRGNTNNGPLAAAAGSNGNGPTSPKC